MYKTTITICLATILTGCITPVSSSCQQSEMDVTPHNQVQTERQKCNEVDAAMYLASALYKEAQKTPKKEKGIEDPANGKTKCSGLVGKTQKECLRNDDAAYDPLDEL